MIWESDRRRDEGMEACRAGRGAFQGVYINYAKKKNLCVVM